MSEQLKVILTKVRTSHNNLPGESFVGWIDERPAIGKSLIVNMGTYKAVHTTSIGVIRFLSERELEFDTKNSTYRLEYVTNDQSRNTIYLSPLESDILGVFVHHDIHDNLEVIAALRTLDAKLVSNRA